MTIRWSTDLLTGMLFVAIALSATATGLAYPFGTANHMGAGFFPRIVASLLTLIGAFLVVRSFIAKGEEVGEIDLRPLLLLLGTLVFGLVIEDLGFPVAGLLLVILARLGGRHFKPVETGLLAVGLVGLCVLVFAYGLGLNLPLTRFW